MLFVAGCEENRAQFHPQFDRIILLSTPVQTMMQRLANRTSNPYGKTPGDLDRVLSDTKNIEPLLRQVADHEISTTMPLGDIVGPFCGLSASDLLAYRKTSRDIRKLRCGAT